MKVAAVTRPRRRPAAGKSAPRRRAPIRARSTFRPATSADERRASAKRSADAAHRCIGSDQPNIRLRPVFLLEHLRHHRARTNHTFLNKFIFTERTEFRTEHTEPNTLSAL